MRLRFLSMFLFAALVTFALSACDDDDIAGPRDTTPERLYPVPTTENALISNFERSWGELNVVDYRASLHEDFQFWFEPRDVDLAPAGQTYWNHTEEMAAVERMLGGEEGLRFDGSPQPAVESIQIALTPVDQEWSDVAPGETIAGETELPPDARRRRYDVDMRVDYTLGDIISEIASEQLFYVVPTEIETGDDAGETEWKLLVWRELGNFSKATESSRWGRLKAVYAEAAEETNSPATGAPRP